MKRIRLSLCAVLSFFLSSSESNAVEWVPFNGEVPENVARITTDPVGPPICTSSSPRMTRVGWLNEKGVCTTAGTGNNSKEYNEGISLLSGGEKATFLIPGNLAYGEMGAGGIIPPNATLIFDVELVEIN